MEYEILTPKTEKGERYVPMIDDVSECFRRIIENRKKPKVEPIIDGYCGFLCLDKNEMPMVALHWEKYFQHIREKYNSIYKVQIVRRHIVGGTYRTLISVQNPLRLCRTGICRRLSAG